MVTPANACKNNLKDHEEEINRIDTKLVGLSKELEVAARKTRESVKSTRTLSSELQQQYNDLRQRRMDVATLYQDMLDNQQALRRGRNNMVKAQQRMFEVELDVHDQEIWRRWEKREMSPKLACARLLEALQKVLDDQTEQEIEHLTVSNENEANATLDPIQIIHIDSSQDEKDPMLLVPLSLMELFFQVDVEVPAFKSEIVTTMTRLSELRDNA